MSKVYIVTSGSYSEYQIERVLKDKELAERYAKAIYDGQVEEYEIEDTTVKQQLDENTDYYVLRINYSVDKTAQTYFDYNVHNSIRDNVDENGQKIKLKSTANYYYTKNSYYAQGDHEQVSVSFVLDQPIDANNPKVQKKYKKIVTDLFAQVKSLRVNEGWTDRMINDWLREKYSDRQIEGV